MILQFYIAALILRLYDASPLPNDINLLKRGFVTQHSAIMRPTTANVNHMIARPMNPNRSPFVPKGIDTPSMSDILPISISIANNRYVISKFVGSGIEGKVFEAYNEADSKKHPVILKIFHSNDPQTNESSFMNEKRALRLQSRLIQADRRRLVLVSKKVEGELFHIEFMNHFAENDDIYCARLLEKYFDLLPSFREKFGLVHGDAHPDNILVDDDGELQFIDFGRTQPLSKDAEIADSQISSDDFIAVSWIEYYMKLLEAEL